MLCVRKLDMEIPGTRKVVRTPTNPFEVDDTVEVFVRKEIIAPRIQDIFPGSNKDRKTDHLLVVWEGLPWSYDPLPSLGELSWSSLN